MSDYRDDLRWQAAQHRHLYPEGETPGDRLFQSMQGAYRMAEIERAVEAGSDLDGATDPGDLAAIPATPGEFAARWNSWDEFHRAEFLKAMVKADERSSLCLLTHDGVRWVPTYTG